MGFCLISIVAVLAASLADQGERVLILDYDAHHGNGTQDVFYHDPRVLFVGYGETDEWAHAGKYDLYLRSAQNMDAYLAQLWARVQSDPRTRDKTTMIVSTDHGRGWGREWTDHGKDVAGAEFIWTAVIGPDTPARGVRVNTPVQQAQVAATIAALLGRDWQKAEPKAAPPLPIFR
jgi:phosphopentomutase